MAGKMMKLTAAAVLAWVVVLAAAPSASANFAKLGCIAMCMRECRVVGVAAPACLKFCPKHCDPPLPSRPVFHCTLDCLNQCVSSQSTRNNNNDEEKQDTCITSCKNEKCGPTP